MEPYEKIVELINDDKNIFISGYAGSGKSFNTNKAIEILEEENPNINIARTALTGTASLQLPYGETLHRCLGLGINKNIGDINKVVNARKFQMEIKDTIRAIDILIVDEISMLRSDLMELIDGVLKYVFDNDKAFGGMQVIFVGDMMQLPPVVRSDENLPEPWAFQSKVWQDLDLEIVYLRKVYRQEDMEFSNALNFIRAGICNEKIYNYIKATENRKLEVKPVRLFGTNNEVNGLNMRELSFVDEIEESYSADIWAKDEFLEKRIIKDCTGMQELVLKEGCQVMILVNGDNYVNGSMGKYRGPCQVVKEEWNNDIKEMETNVYPGVKVELFSNNKVVKIAIHEWKIEKDSGNEEESNEILASFKQYPIKLGYAVTVHKSQGMSIDYLEVDCTRFFAPGMAYVALSRARSYENLVVKNFNPRIVNADPMAFGYYKSLSDKGVI